MYPRSATRPLTTSMITGLLAILLFSLVTSHFWHIYDHAVNIPYGDDWEMLGQPDYLGRFNLKWIFAQHNEHRIVPTKLQIWLLYQWNSWNLQTQIIQNFIIYITFALIFARFIMRHHPTVLPALLLSLSFLFSTVASENHSWGFQSQFHFVLIFSLLACDSLFREKLTWPTVALASCWSLLAEFSFSSGVPMILALNILLTMMVCYRFLNRSSHLASDGLKLLTYTSIVWLSLLAYFSFGYERLNVSPAYAWPNSLLFWTHFLHLIASGFAISTDSMIPGTILLIGTLSPILILAVRQLRSDRFILQFWRLAALYALIFSALFTITVGRAGFGYGQAGASRYAEFTVLLIPISIAGYWLVFNARSAYQWASIAMTLLLAGYCFRSQWNFSGTYRIIAESRQEGIRCLADSISANQVNVCPSIYPFSIVHRLDVAQSLQISFTKNLNAKPQVGDSLKF